MANIIVLIAFCYCCTALCSCDKSVKYEIKTEPGSFIEGEGFDTTLTCQDVVLGDANNALFYRNGADLHTDPCLNKSVYEDNSAMGKVKLRITSECDGYYLCGVKQSDGYYILSKPKPIYSEPTETGNSSEATIIRVEEGESAKLPCKISSSPINVYETEWYKQVPPDVIRIKTLTTQGGEDNSLVLKNVTSLDQYTYYCSVRRCKPTKQSSTVSSFSKGKIKLQTEKKFVAPIFLRNLSYDIDDEGTAHFIASVAENLDYPVEYHWEVNDTTVNNSTPEKPHQLDIANISYGWTKVRVSIWNQKYTGMRYSDEQTVYINRPLTVEQEEPVSTCHDNVMEIIGLSVNAQLAVILAAIIPSVIILAVCAIIILLMYKKMKKSRRQASTNNSSSDISLEEMNPLPKIFKRIENFASNGIKADIVILQFLQNLVTWLCKSDKIVIDTSTKSNLKNLLKDIQKFIIESDDQIVEDCTREEMLESPISDDVGSDIRTDDDNRSADGITSRTKLIDKDSSNASTKNREQQELKKCILREIEKKMNELEETE